MSTCDYKFKLKASLKGGVATSSLEEKYTFTRRVVELHLAKLNQKPKLDLGQQRMKEILTDALAKPGWTTITFRKKS